MTWERAARKAQRSGTAERIAVRLAADDNSMRITGLIHRITQAGVERAQPQAPADLPASRLRQRIRPQ